MATVLALVDDLMFLSRIREAARGTDVDVRTARTAAALVAACREAQPTLVLADLDSARLPVIAAIEALRAETDLAGVKVVGFVSHMNADRARMGREAGCATVLARSAFVQDLPEILRGIEPARRELE
jgi:DNA-binding NarL/FixJ family response regulator